jgi:plasmid stabilization system protein ParE
MRLQWTVQALSDLSRLHDFLAPANPTAAARAVQALVKAPAKLLSLPRMGELLSEFDPREVRRILVGSYEVRYEITNETITVLRLCTRERTASYFPVPENRAKCWQYPRSEARPCR